MSKNADTSSHSGKQASYQARLLDLFCGAGGATRGYQQAGFYVVGVDIRPQPHYCGNSFVLMDAIDALQLLIAGEYVCDSAGRRWRLADFAAVHASPPCQAYTGMRNITISRFGTAPDHPDLIEITRRGLEQCGLLYVIENVQNSPLHTQVILCGVSMGLPHLARHRHFESNVLIVSPPKCSHRSAKYTIGVYGEKPDGRRVSYKHHRLGRIAKGLDEARSVMGIDWMDWDEIRLAIPPAYTEFIGRQLMNYLRTP